MMLRDHSQPCEHGELKHRRPGAVWLCERHMCPGGREVTIDYEAATEALRMEWGVTEQFDWLAKVTVDAALGGD